MTNVIPKPKDRTKAKVHAGLRQHLAACLKLLGYDTSDPNLRDTPARVARIWQEELTIHPPTKKLYSVFKEQSSQMVCLIGHQATTHCPHHLERADLTVSIAYLPAGRVIGLSKLARIADYYAQGMVLQERYVEQIAEGLMAALLPLGVAVHCEGTHNCMRKRGVQSSGHIVTTALRGMFMDNIATRDEFLRYVLHKKK